MSLGQRIESRRKALGITQTEVARRAKVPQSTLNTIINGDSRWSPHLVRLARELHTSVQYLTGETDDPDVDAPPPPPEPQVVHVMLPVALPATPALTRMYQGLLRSLGDWQSMPEAELAHELATLLPTGLGVVKGPLRYEAPGDDDRLQEPVADRPADDRARRRA